MKSLATGLTVLSEFARDRSDWTVSELSSKTGLNKSRLSKILAALRDSGFVQQDHRSRAYSVGPRAVALGGNYINASPLAREAVGHMRELVDATRQTAVLSVVYENEVMYLLAVEGPLFVDVGWRVGAWLPFHATAVGKVLAAHLEPERLDEMIAAHGLPRITRRTICDPGKLRQHLARIRRSGIGETRSEGTEGLAATAVPVLGQGGRVIAALGFVYPARILDTDRHRELAAHLHRAAGRLSVRMGARVYPYGALPDDRC